MPNSSPVKIAIHPLFCGNTVPSDTLALRLCLLSSLCSPFLTIHINITLAMTEGLENGENGRSLERGSVKFGGNRSGDYRALQ